ncbi:MAG: CbiX/SirB N-terminal domain-containing protein [bacterium]
MATDHLVILAHGSSREAWRAPIEALSARIAERSAGPVHLAWLEAAPPDLEAVLAGAVAQGATAVRVLPLFWSSGGHVARDVRRWWRGAAR